MNKRERARAERIRVRHIQMLERRLARLKRIRRDCDRDLNPLGRHLMECAISATEKDIADMWFEAIEESR